MQIYDRAYRHIAMKCVGGHCLVSSPGGPVELKTLKAQNALQVFRKKNCSLNKYCSDIHQSKYFLSVYLENIICR